MMRKYLMTGLVAVALGGLFSSCSKDVETGEENTVEFNILQTYENAFVTRFGQPAENQTWGFGSHAGTRTENANANEWADPNKAYGGLLVPPAITPTQAAVVKTYFQTHDKLGYQDPGWSNYFIQQVYKGYSDVPDGCATPERYLSAAGGDAYIYASDHMDHLIAVDTERGIVDHINNFNHGDCGENYNVLDNGGNANDGPFHTDKIMYMQNSTTKSFAYHNSDGSLYHTEYTGLVGWETIHNWAVDNYPGYDGCLNDGWKRSFMGFDFEQIVGDDVYSKNVEYDYSGGWKPEYETQGWPIKSVTYNTFEFEGNTYNFLTSETNMYAADRNEDSYVLKNGSTSTDPGKANFNNTPSADIIRDLISKGYLPYSDTLKDWVKVGGTADGYFSDWIVTLTEAKTGTTPPPPTPPTGFVCRIIAEDLTVGENSDFDFNDVVFDVIEGGTVLRLRAAGGELPLYVAGQEVHAAFAEKYPNDGITQTTLINTGWKGSTLDYNNYYVDISSGGTYSTPEAANDIVVQVEKKGQTITLTAKRAKVASKVCVGSDYKWCPERIDIDGMYHKADGTKLFQQYVIGNLGGEWWNGTAWYQQLGQ